MSLPRNTCLARYEIDGHPQAWTPRSGALALEAATRSSVLLGGSLKAVGFGDGFIPSTLSGFFSLRPIKTQFFFFVLDYDPNGCYTQQRRLDSKLTILCV